ncbi:MAG: WD40/YVTN/BNR-like repeat-containing protein [Halolamina sp.]
MTAYAVYEDALFVVETVGTPALREHRFDARTECIAVTDEALLVGTFDDGLHRSIDGGESWTRVDGMGQTAVTALAVAPTDQETVYAGTEPSAVYRSTDGGETFAKLDGLLDLPSSDEWSFPPRPDTHHVRWIEPDPNHPSLLHVAIEAGALVRARLGEDGVDWTDRVPGTRRDVHTIATHPDAPGLAMVAAGDGYGETTDGGESWQRPHAGLDHTYCWSVAVGLNEASTGISTPNVLLSAASGANAAHRRGESYLYRREGGAWERLDDNGIPTGPGTYRAVLERGADEATFWAATNHGLHRTDDGGDSWTTIDVEWPDRIDSQACRGLVIAD